MSDFEIKCHGVFAAKRFRLIELPENVKEEFFKKAYCPICENFIIFYTRIFKTGKLNKRVGKLRNEKAIDYLIKNQDNCIEILDSKIESGSGSNLNWKYGKNNSIYNFNDKAQGSRITNPINTIKASFTPELQKVI